jgi:hypothetical protein
MKYVKHYTVQEWKKLCKTIHSAANVGNQIQFINYQSAKEEWLKENPTDSFEIHVELGGFVNWKKYTESYDYLTTAEVILYRYKVVLTDHHNRHSNKMVTVPLKEKLKDGLKSLPSKMTMQNFDKGMAAFDKGMADFNKSMDQFGEGIGGKKDSKSKMEKLWGKSKSNDTNFITGKKSKSNLEKIWGTSSKKKSNSVKIWSDPVQKKRKSKSKRKTSKSDEWDNREAIWGKSKKFKL